MSFIGVIAKEKNRKYLCEEISNRLNKNQYNIIGFSKENIQNLKNIKFETVIILEELEKFEYYKQTLKQILKQTKYLIINSDLNLKSEIFKDLETIVITFGLNTKSTITISSINEENILICIQRNIKDINQKLIEPEEFKVENKNKIDIYNILSIVGTLKIYGKKVENF